MYSTAGSKIKSAARILGCLGIIFSLIAGLSTIKLATLQGIGIALIGFLCSWLSTLLLYGFGQLIENTDALIGLNKQIISNQNKQQTASNTNAAQHQQRRCSNCGNLISGEICPICKQAELDSLTQWKLDALAQWKADGLISDYEYNKKVDGLKNK